MSKSSVERDTARWPHAFAGMYARIRYSSYLHVLAFVVIGVQAWLMFTMATRASAHVYEIRPTGETVYIGDRESSLAPRAIEVTFLARRFVSLLYGWNSSTVHDDLSEAINMCAPSLGSELRQEVASAGFIKAIRKKRVRAELELKELNVEKRDRQYLTVSAKGVVHLYPLTRYEGQPVESRPLELRLIIAVVPRSTARPSGLEIVRLERPGARDGSQ